MTEPRPADQYPTPPDLSPEEVARRRARSRRTGQAILGICLAIAVVTVIVLLSFEPSR